MNLKCDWADFGTRIQNSLIGFHIWAGLQISPNHWHLEKIF